MRKALLIIDVQNDYFPGWNMELVGAEEALAQVELVLAEFRVKNDPIIHIQHINMREGATFFLPNSQGAEIHNHLTPKDGEYVVVKNSPNSFHQTSLLEIIEKLAVEELVVCGMMTHMCIDTTVRLAKDYSLSVTLLHDGCATRNLSFQNQEIPAVQVQAAYMAGLSGMFAKVVSTKEFLQSLL